jgi:hypothetical protein
MWPLIAGTDHNGLIHMFTILRKVDEKPLMNNLTAADHIKILKKVKAASSGKWLFYISKSIHTFSFILYHNYINIAYFGPNCLIVYITWWCIFHSHIHTHVYKHKLYYRHTTNHNIV